MKKKLTVIFSVAAILLSMTVPSFALSSPHVTQDIAYYPDGSYAIIETTIAQSPAVCAAAASTKSASRTYTYYSKDNQKEWDFTLKGTFTYNGSTAKATAASTSYNIYISGWKCDSKKDSLSGASAKGTGTFVYKSGITKTTTLGLKCSAKGEISAA